MWSSNYELDNPYANASAHSQQFYSSIDKNSGNYNPSTNNQFYSNNKLGKNDTLSKYSTASNYHSSLSPKSKLNNLNSNSFWSNYTCYSNSMYSNLNNLVVAAVANDTVPISTSNSNVINNSSNDSFQRTRSNSSETANLPVSSASFYNSSISYLDTPASTSTTPGINFFSF